MTSGASERRRAATDAIGGPAEPWRFHVVTVHVRATVVISTSLTSRRRPQT